MECEKGGTSWWLLRGRWGGEVLDLWDRRWGGMDGARIVATRSSPMRLPRGKWERVGSWIPLSNRKHGSTER
jgi:hypothetical protein